LIVTITAGNGVLAVQRDAPLVGNYSDLIYDQYDTNDTRTALPLLLSTGVLSTDKSTDPNMLLPTDREDALYISGDILEINDILSTLKYRPHQDIVGSDYLNVTVWDANTLDMVIWGTIEVNIMAMNDRPIISFPDSEAALFYENNSLWEVGYLTTKEDMPLSIGQYINISDVDIETEYSNLKQYNAFRDIPFSGGGYSKYNGITNDKVFLHIEASHGKFTPSVMGSSLSLFSPTLWTVGNLTQAILENNCHNDVNVDVCIKNLQLNNLIKAHNGLSHEYNSQYHDNTGAIKSRELLALGKLIDIQEFVSSLVYVPDRDWYGMDMVGVYLNDLGNIGKGDFEDLQRYILINITEVNDPPIIELPEIDMLTAQEDIVGVIGVDCCSVDDGHSVEIENFVGDSYSDLSALSIRILDPDSHIRPREKRIVVRNTSTYFIHETNDPIYNVTYGENFNSEILAYEYQVPNVENALKLFTVSLLVQHGTLSIMRASEQIEFLQGSGFQDDSIVIRGTLLHINEALRGLNYLADPNWNSLSPTMRSAHYLVDHTLVMEVLSITVEDQYGDSVSSSIDIYVQPMNDAPVIYYGSRARYDNILLESEDTTRQRVDVESLVCYKDTNCPVTDLDIHDIDVLESVNGMLTVTVSARNGSVFLDPLQTISNRTESVSDSFDYVAMESNDDLRSDVLRFAISPTESHSLFNHILYRPYAMYVGTDMLTIEVNDNGYTGVDNTWKSDMMFIPVVILNRPDDISILTDDFILDCNENGATAVFLQFIDNSLGAASYMTDNGTLHSSSQYLVDISSGEGQLEFSADKVNLITASFEHVDHMKVGGSHVRITGELYNLNTFVKGMTFAPKPDFNVINGGIATVTVTIQDLNGEDILTDTTLLENNHLRNIEVPLFEVGQNGKEDGLRADAIAKTHIPIRVNSINTLPTVHVPGEIYTKHQSTLNNNGERKSVVSVQTKTIEEDVAYSLGEFYLDDVDSGEDTSNYQIWSYLTAEHGYFTSTNGILDHVMEILVKPPTHTLPSYYNSSKFNNSAEVRQFNASNPNNNIDYMNGDSNGEVSLEWTVLQQDLDIPEYTTAATFDRKQYGSEVTDSGSNYVRMQGSIKDINHFMQFIEYKPYSHYNGDDTITFSICERQRNTMNSNTEKVSNGISVVTNWVLQVSAAHASPCISSIYT
jgi:hypothetical protein